MAIFSEKKIECRKIYFLKIMHFFIAEMGKLLVKAGSKRGLTAPPKPLVAIGVLQYDFCQTNKLYFKPCIVFLLW